MHVDTFQQPESVRQKWSDCLVRLIHKIKTATDWVFRRPQVLLLAAGQNGLLNFIPDKPYLKMVFRAETGYRLNLKHPKTYNEKLQWIKLYDRKPEYTTYADKICRSGTYCTSVG